MEQRWKLPKLIAVEKNHGIVENAENIVVNDESFSRIQYNFFSGSPNLVFDFGKKVTGYLFFKLGANSEDNIIVEYGPVFDCLHFKKVLTPVNCGEVFIDSNYIACRYIKLSFESNALQPQAGFIEIRQFGLIDSKFPCEYLGRFHSSDKDIDKIFKRGTYTVHLCMQKSIEMLCGNRNLPQKNIDFIKNWKGAYSDYVIFDAPRRDRETWLGDIRAEAKTIYTAIGDYSVAKNTLQQFVDLQSETGSITASGGTWQQFFEYSLWFAISIWEYYFYSNDSEFLKKNLNVLVKLYNLILYKRDDRGFIEADNNWMWTIPREGYSSLMQSVLYYALDCLEKVFTLVEYDDYKNEVSKHKSNLKENFNAVFWNEEKGIYNEKFSLNGCELPIVTDSNCYAIIFGLADTKQSQRILEYLKLNMWTPFGSTTIDKKIIEAKISDKLKYYGLRDHPSLKNNPKEGFAELLYPHNKQVWPFIVAYEVQARFEMEDYENAMELIKLCWNNPAYDETDTYWEMFDIESQHFCPRPLIKDSKGDCINSAAHGWSGWIAHIIQEYILGVRPLTPGYKKTVIKPCICGISHLKGTVPTPFGRISCEINISEDEFAISVSYPASIEIEIQIPQKSLGKRATRLDKMSY